jgi:hypothetical protein
LLLVMRGRRRIRRRDLRRRKTEGLEWQSGSIVGYVWRMLRLSSAALGLIPAFRLGVIESCSVHPEQNSLRPKARNMCSERIGGACIVERR